MIPFNKPCILGDEKANLMAVFDNQKFSGDGPFSKKCHQSLENLFVNSKALLTTSCTDALEMSAILADILPGDEVIMPSFTFVSTANAFVLRGARIVFVDVDPLTMNMDTGLIEAAITIKTKAIVAVHYAGWSCDMNELMSIINKYNLILIEDAAQAISTTFQGKLLGTFGTFSTLSFHETKNIQCGEGGALLINEDKYFQRAEIIREKGINRSIFLRGQTDKYTWVDTGSSFLPSELNAAFLLPQLEQVEKITKQRLKLWDLYKSYFQELSIPDIEILDAPDYCEHNAHLFAIKTPNLAVRTNLIEYLKQNNILAPFHYVPLHSSPAGRKFGTFHGQDKFTTHESERLVRLPLFYSLTETELSFVCDKIGTFFKC